MDFLKTYIKLVVNQVCAGVGVTRVTATPKPPSNVCGGRLLLSDQCDDPQGRGYPVIILAMLARAPETLFSLRGITDMLGKSMPYLLGLL